MYLNDFDAMKLLVVRAQSSLEVHTSVGPTNRGRRALGPVRLIGQAGSAV